MDSGTQKFAAWISGVFVGIWLILLLTGGPRQTSLLISLSGLKRWMFMLSPILVGFFAGVSGKATSTNWTKVVALGSVAVAVQIFLTFTIDYVYSIIGLPGFAGAIWSMIVLFSTPYTSIFGGYFIGAYLTRE